MAKKKSSLVKIILIWGFFAIVGLIAAFYSLNNYIYQQKQEPNPTPPQSIESQRTTLVGEHTCLPHADTSGPQTLECALGIKTDDGNYYALDFSLTSQQYPNIPGGARISANGILTPIENLSTDHWKKYNVKGIFSITDSFEILE